MLSKWRYTGIMEDAARHRLRQDRSDANVATIRRSRDNSGQSENLRDAANINPANFERSAGFRRHNPTPRRTPMKKSDLLDKIAVLLKATDHIPDDVEIDYVFIAQESHIPTSIRCKFLPEGEIKKDWYIKGESISESVEAHGCQFIRITKVEMVMP